MGFVFLSCADVLLLLTCGLVSRHCLKDMFKIHNSATEIDIYWFLYMSLIYYYYKILYFINNSLWSTWPHKPLINQINANYLRSHYIDNPENCRYSLNSVFWWCQISFQNKRNRLFRKVGKWIWNLEKNMWLQIICIRKSKLLNLYTRT